MARHGPSLARIAASYTPPGPEREDLLQDISVALLGAMRRFRGECTERTYVLRVAHNCGWQRVRQRARSAPLHGDNPAAETAGNGPTPEELSASRQESERLLEAVRTLPLGVRQVVVSALEGLEIREIAELLGISSNAASVRLHRGKTQIRKYLQRTSHGQRTAAVV